MLQAATQFLEPSCMRRLAEEPDGLERGLKVLDVGLRLSPGLVVDLVLRDQASRPVVVLGEGSDGPEALFGRAVCVLAEVRRMRDLLDRLFRQEGVSFGADPRVILVARRFADALHAARDLLVPLKIELVEAHEVPSEGQNRLVVVRAGRATATGALPAADPVPPIHVNGTGHANGIAANGAANVTASNGAGHGVASRAASSRAPNLVDEAKKKILRISDDIEEEVDGDLIRFRLHDELIAVLDPDVASRSGASIAVGDSPDVSRPLAERSDLNAAIDDVVRRYFTLARQFTAKRSKQSRPIESASS